MNIHAVDRRRTGLAPIVFCLILLIAPPACATSISVDLLVNGGFETPGRLVGWRTIETLEHSAFGSGPDFKVGQQVLTAHSGLRAAAFYGVGLGGDGIAQTFDTVQGQHYLVSLWLSEYETCDNSNAHNHCGDWNSWRIFWDADLVMFGKASYNQPWTEYTFDVVAASSRSTFAFYGDNLFGYTRLDDITIMPWEPDAMVSRLTLIPDMSALPAWAFDPGDIFEEALPTNVEMPESASIALLAGGGVMCALGVRRRRRLVKS